MEPDSGGDIGGMQSVPSLSLNSSGAADSTRIVAVAYPRSTFPVQWSDS